VELSELTASGLLEPRADWTAAAREYITEQVQELLAPHDVIVGIANTLDDPREAQLSLLHDAVGKAILTHLYTPGYELPQKGKALDWTIGPGAAVLQRNHNADYGLFIYVRDSYTTAGRALVILGAAAFGVSVDSGQQLGFASLVDLRTGNI